MFMFSDFDMQMFPNSLQVTISPIFIAPPSATLRSSIFTSLTFQHFLPLVIPVFVVSYPCPLSPTCM